jgi:hypothetical protein
MIRYHGMCSYDEYEHFERENRERQAEAVRKFYERERLPGIWPTWRQAGWFFCKFTFWMLLAWAVICGFLVL